MQIDAAWQQLILIALVSTSTLALLLLLLTRFHRETTHAKLRLDWYLPAVRRTKSGQLEGNRLLTRLAQKLLPAGWFSNRKTKQRGMLRRLLRKFGLTWLASPVRRLSQLLCGIAFLVLFLYVCWPYSARPAGSVPLVDALQFSRLDQNQGDIIFQSPSSDHAMKSHESLFLVHGQGADDSLAREVELISVSDASEAIEFRLQPLEAPDDAFLDALLLGRNEGWSLWSHDPQAWPSHYADELASKEWVPAEFFLAIDPLVSLSTAIASRSWVWSLAAAAMILVACLLIPRGFCGYVCPLGSTIDLFDWAIGRRVTRFRLPADGWWVHIKYYLLAATLICALFGVLISGFVAAIPVVTRAALMLLDPVENGALRGWHLVPGMHAGHFFSLALFFGILSLGFFQPRFWCKYVCPSGAVFSVGNLFRVTERKVESSCIHCNKCVEVCPFDAIKPDFTTRVTDCTLCQTCAGVCPTHAIKFVERNNIVELKLEDDPPTGETPIGRRGFLSLASGSAAAIAGGSLLAATSKIWGGHVEHPGAYLPVRPPGSVPEQEFLEMCIRCGECFKACPNNVLQVQGFEQGFEGLWTPVVKADWAGCESSCNACGQVCPTGAIRALPLEEKRVARMGLAVVNENTCLPFADREDCDLCVQECIAAGYDALEYEQVGTQVDALGQPIPGSGRLAPVVIEDRCVGCGLCQTRCYAINVKQRGILDASAIVVEAGPGKEDRLMTGSYRELRKAENAPPSDTSFPGMHEQQDIVDEPTGSADDFGENPFGL